VIFFAYDLLSLPASQSRQGGCWSRLL